jgi:NADPH-dependent 2,4-dienoyl-CoA reductase/sulfur reductase-like enzyme
VIRKQKDLLMKGLNWRNEKILKIDPENNTLETDQGNTVKYDWLVASPGLTLRYDKIEGAQEAIDDPNSPVGSIYCLDGAYKTSRLRESFKGGKAVFMLP